MKITEYAAVTDLDSSNVFLVDGDNGTKTIKGSDLTYALFDGIPEMHSQIWRGKNLGETFTSEQSETVKSGKFHDLWLGDYWEKNGIKYRIVDFDYYYMYCEPTFTQHHLVIMPDEPLEDSVPFHTSNDIFSVGYSGASVRKSAKMVSATSKIEDMFGAQHVLTYKSFLAHSVDSYPSFSKYICSSNYSWVDARVELPSLQQLFGTDGMASTINQSFNFNQFKALKMNPSIIYYNPNNYNGHKWFNTTNLLGILGSDGNSTTIAASILGASGYALASDAARTLKVYFIIN